MTNIALPEGDPNFAKIRELHTISLQKRWYEAQATVRVAQAQSEQQYRTAEEQSQAAIEAARREVVLQQQLTETEALRREAERTVIAAEASAQAAKLSGLAEAEVMAAQGYDGRDALQAEVQKAYAAGIGNMGSGGAGSGGAGVTGDMMGLGVGIAMASAIAPQIGGAMQGMFPQNGQQQMPATAFRPTPVVQPSAVSWDCVCGQTANTGASAATVGRKRG